MNELKIPEGWKCTDNTVVFVYYDSVEPNLSQRGEVDMGYTYKTNSKSV